MSDSDTPSTPAWGAKQTSTGFGATPPPPAAPPSALDQIAAALGQSVGGDAISIQITVPTDAPAAAPPAAAPAFPTAPAEPAPVEPAAQAEVSVPAAWGGKKTGAAFQGVQEDKSLRVVHAPLAKGIGTGKAFFFLFGFKIASEIDQGMLKREMEQIDDDVEVLRNAGYTVIVDPQASREDFTATLYSEGAGEGVAGLIPAGFYWSAHGHSDGGIETCDGSLVHATTSTRARSTPDCDSRSSAPAMSARARLRGRRRWAARR